MIKIKERIQQKDEYGCAIACLAMILDDDYDDVKKDFCTNFATTGLDTEVTMQYIIDNTSYGVVLVDFARIRRYKTLDRKEMFLKPFADCHLVKVKPRAEQLEHAHLIVMDKDGKIFDPHSEANTSLDNYYDIWAIVGIFE